MEKLEKWLVVVMIIVLLLICVVGAFRLSDLVITGCIIGLILLVIYSYAVYKNLTK